MNQLNWGKIREGTTVRWMRGYRNVRVQRVPQQRIKFPGTPVYVLTWNAISDDGRLFMLSPSDKVEKLPG